MFNAHDKWFAEQKCADAYTSTSEKCRSKWMYSAIEARALQAFNALHAILNEAYQTCEHKTRLRRAHARTRRARTHARARARLAHIVHARHKIVDSCTRRCTKVSRTAAHTLAH